MERKEERKTDRNKNRQKERDKKSLESSRYYVGIGFIHKTCTASYTALWTIYTFPRFYSVNFIDWFK